MRIRRTLSRSLIKPVLAACTLVVMSGALHADTTRAADPAPVPLLWKVSAAHNSLYLLGSFHPLKPTDYPLSSDVDVAFAEADKLVFELAPEEMGSPALGMQMGQAALRTDGTQLNSELPEDTIAALDAWVQENADHLAKMQMNGQVL